MGLVVVRDRCRVAATLINRDFPRQPLAANRFTLRITLRRKASAAALSRCGVNRKSVVYPSVPTARDK
jgi:hypothetical protein